MAFLLGILRDCGFIFLRLSSMDTSGWVVLLVLFGAKYKRRLQRRRSSSMYLLRSSSSRISRSTLRSWFISGGSSPCTLFPVASSGVLMQFLRVFMMRSSFTHTANRHYNVFPRAVFSGVERTGASGLGVSLSGSASMDFPVSSAFCYDDFLAWLAAGWGNLG